MKKIIAILLTTVLMLSCFSMAVSAKVGDVIGQALHTDIVAYINHYAIPSYAVNGQSVIVAEDLRNFGFDVTWNGYNRTLTITRNGNTWVTPMDFSKDGVPSTKFSNLYSTDIKVYANGIQIPSYAINGYTMIPMESLNMFGEIYWVANERALKMWVDGLHIRTTKQPITAYTTNYTGFWDAAPYNKSAAAGSYTITVYGQQGNRVNLYIEAIASYGRRLGIANIENVYISNGVGTFRYEDSFSSRGTGTIYFKPDGTMTVTYNEESSNLWSISVGGNLTYYRTGPVPVDFRPTMDF